MPRLITILLLLTLGGCVIYPMRVVLPLETTVVDSSTGKPVPNVKYIRVVCDIHDFSCKEPTIDTGESDENGRIGLSGHRKWGVWLPLPGGLPAPNHQIAIWAEGYKVVIFSQYDDDIERFKNMQRNIKVKLILDAIPKKIEC